MNEPSPWSLRHLPRQLSVRASSALVCHFEPSVVLASSAASPADRNKQRSHNESSETSKGERRKTRKETLNKWEQERNRAREENNGLETFPHEQQQRPLRQPWGKKKHKEINNRAYIGQFCFLCSELCIFVLILLLQLFDHGFLCMDRLLETINFRIQTGHSRGRLGQQLIKRG